VDCELVNADDVLGKQFDRWHTSEDGRFAQDPEENAKVPYKLFELGEGSEKTKWEVFASKRRASYPLQQARHLYDLEKRMLCAKRHKPPESKMTCCVAKFVNLVRNETKDDWETMNTAAAQLRNF